LAPIQLARVLAPACGASRHERRCGPGFCWARVRPQCRRFEVSILSAAYYLPRPRLRNFKSKSGT